MPTNFFHSAGVSGGLGPGRIASEDWPNAERALKSNASGTSENGFRNWSNLRCAPGFSFKGPTFDKFTPDMIAETRRIGNANGSLRRNFHLRLDHVFNPVPFAGGDVTRKGIAGQGRNRDIVGASDAAFEHATAPSRDILCEAICLHRTRAGMSADAAEFDVDDPRSPELNGGFRVAEVANGFIEAERSFQ